MAAHARARLAPLALAALVVLTAGACKERAHSPVGSGKPSVVATIHPLEMLVRELAGANVEVSSLLPPGSSPHTYEPTTGDVTRVARAALVVRVGGGVDAWLDKLEAVRSGKTRTLTLLDAPGIQAMAFEADAAGASRSDSNAPAVTEPTHAHHDAGIDPHVWLDPLRVRDAIVPALVEALSGIDPAGATAYRQAGQRMHAELTGLDADINKTLAAARGRSYVAFHNAWRYFAQRYDLHEIGVVEEFAGEEPSPAEIAELVRTARKAHLPGILVEPQLSTRVARTIASEFGGVTVVVDPLGDPGDERRSTYASLMRFNAAAFARALGGTSNGAHE